MPTPTAFRVLKDAVIAVAHQTAFGTPAQTTTVQKWQVVSSEIDPGFEYIHPAGTTGSFRPKDTHQRVAKRPKASLEVLASPKVLPFIWEYALAGQPQATLANGDVTETGDSAGDLSAWVLNGVRPGFNTDSLNRIYAKLEDETPSAGQARVSLYSDAARTQLAAQGSAANGNTVTLAEQNQSGLSGTVALAAPAASNLAGIFLTVVQVRPQESGVLSRFLTMWRDHGPSTGLERLQDCAIEKLMRSSDEAGVVRYKLDIVAADYSFDTGAGGTFVPGLAIADKEYQVHGTMTFHSDVDGANLSQHALKLEMGIENDLEVVLANAATASAIYKRSVKAYPITCTQKLTAEAQAIAVRGLTDTWESIRIVDQYAARTATFLWDKVKSVEPAFPKTGEDGWDDVEHKFQAVEETAGSPAAPLTVTLML
jgi:hypothetical protein